MFTFRQLGPGSVCGITIPFGEGVREVTSEFNSVFRLDISVVYLGRLTLASRSRPGLRFLIVIEKSVAS